MNASSDHPAAGHPRRASTRKAIAGSAAAAGIFALQQNTEAAIVYTNPTDIVVSPNPGGVASAGFDINGGGNDFRIFAKNAPSATAPVGFADLLPAVASVVGMLTSGNALRKLASGAAISAGALAAWKTSGQVMRSVYGPPFSGAFGPWVAGQTGFAGVRFDAGGGNFNYGWIRMSVGDVNPADGYVDTVTVFDYAYETTVNAPLAAGAGAAVPEPSRALIMLAGLGAAGLRRRRKASVACP